MNKKYKYFSKIFIVISLILILLFTSVLMVFYNTQQKNNRQKNLIQQNSMFEKNGSEFDNIFNILITIGEFVFENESVKYYVSDNAPYYEMDFSNIVKINSILSQKQTSFSYFNIDMMFFKPNNDLVIMPNITCNQKDMEEKYGITFKQIEKLFEQNQKEGYYYVIPPQNRKDKLYIAHKRVYRDNSIGYLVTMFPRTACNFYSDEDNRINLILSENLKSFDVKAYREKFSFFEPGQYKIERFDKESNLFIGRSKSINNLYYVFKYSDEPTNYLILILILTGIILIIISLTVAFFTAKYFYLPIKKVIDIFDSENQYDYGDEFGFIENEATKIIENNYTLTRTLEDKNDILKNRLLFDIINGFVWEEELYKNLKEYDMEFLKDDCICMLFEYENSDKEELIDFMESHIKSTNLCACITLQLNKIVFVISYSDDIEQILMDIINMVKNKFNSSLVMAISEKVKIENFKSAYLDLLTSLEYKFILNSRNIITLKEIEKIKKIDYYYPLETERVLISYVLSGNKENTMILLKNIFERNIFNVAISEKGLTEFKFAITATIKRLLQKIDKTEEIFNSGSVVYLEMTMCNNADELSDKIIHMIKTIMNFVVNENSENSDAVDQDILDYINEKICTDISLTDVSKKFNLSISNISKRLKDRYNIKFKSYINEKKIEKAKELMANDPNIKIKDLALMLGFNNVVSFIRLFKKLENIAPSQYIETL